MPYFSVNDVFGLEEDLGLHDNSEDEASTSTVKKGRTRYAEELLPSSSPVIPKPDNTRYRYFDIPFCLDSTRECVKHRKRVGTIVKDLKE